jgi:serine protease Do
MPRPLLLAPLLLFALAGAGRADEVRGRDLAQALEQAATEAMRRAGPSVACVLVSRSESYVKAPHWGTEGDTDHRGHLGRFDAAAAAKLVPTSAPNRARILRAIAQHDLSDPNNVPESYGSGFVIDRSGLILTNAHVVKGATKVYVRLRNRPGSWADVHACDPRSDLAVLRLLDPPAGLKALPLGDGGAVRPGQVVIGLCNAYAPGAQDGCLLTWDHGQVSRLRQRLDPTKSLNEEQRHKITLHHYGTLIKTDSRAAAGCSGGPLLDLNGKVVGLTCALAAVPGASPGGYAIPFDASTQRIIDVLKRGEEVEYGFLGVMLQAAGGGVRIYRVTPGSPASRGGIIAGDQIVSVNGKPIRENDDLFLHIGIALADTTVRVGVAARHGGAPQIRTVKLAKFYTGGTVIAAKRPPARFGLRVDYTSILAMRNPFPSSRPMPDGVTVREVVPGSPADYARLQPDKVITHVNGKAVYSPREYNEAVARTGRKVELTFLMSDGRPEKLTLEEK